MVGLAPGEGRVGALAGGVEGASLVPLHVTDAAHRLHLGVRGPEVTAVLVVALLQQVLQATVAGVLVPDPPAGRGGGGAGELEGDGGGGVLTPGGGGGGGKTRTPLSAHPSDSEPLLTSLS